MQVGRGWWQVVWKVTAAYGVNVAPPRVTPRGPGSVNLRADCQTVGLGREKGQLRRWGEGSGHALERAEDRS